MDKDPTVIVYAVIVLVLTFSILGYLVSGIIRRIETNDHDEHQQSIKEFLQNEQSSNPTASKDNAQT